MQLCDRLPLGNTGLLVSPACLGLVIDPATVSTAFDAGLNFFFLSADLHWPQYTAARAGLAQLLARQPSVRDQIVVAAACYVASPDFCGAAVLDLLNAIPQLRRVDLVVCGGVREDVAL